MKIRSMAFARNLLAAPLMAVLPMAVHAAYACNMSATSPNGVYASASVLNIPGSATLNCTRLSSDSQNMPYFIRLDNGATTGTRDVYLIGGSNIAADRLVFTISRTGYGGTIWSTGGNQISGTLAFGASLSATLTPAYYFQVASGQTGKTAGIFDNIMTATMSLTTGGAALATTTFTPTVSIVKSCFVGTLGTGAYSAPGAVSPSTLTLNYTSFATVDSTATMNFTVDCTNSTTYTLALSPASGTLIGLAYSLALSPTGTITANGLAQSFTVTGTIAAGQSGTCAAVSHLCSATQATTVTVTY